jgi:hypothetical protein
MRSATIPHESRMMRQRPVPPSGYRRKLLRFTHPPALPHGPKNVVTHLPKNTLKIRHRSPDCIRNHHTPNRLGSRAIFLRSLERCVTNRPPTPGPDPLPSTPGPRPLAPDPARHFAGIGRGVVSPSVIPIAHFTPSIHIFWISGRSQTSSRCPSDEWKTRPLPY